MASLKDKTPVSHLQEYLVSKQMVPHYELVHNGVGTHNPVFTYRVQVGSLWEEGSGRSKREAKHRAAEKMLKSLKIIDSPGAEEEESSEPSVEPAENYVGTLKELCILKNYPEPKYFLEEAAGPPHNRIFKMICCVSQQQDFGVSTTKKQAKHQAAFKMLRRLREYMVDDLPLKPEHRDAPDPKQAEMNYDEVIEKYNALRPASSTTNKDPAVFYKDHHKAYVGLQNTSPTLLNLVNASSRIDSDRALALINDIAKELEVTVSTLEIPTKQSNKQLVIMTISLLPSIAGIGETEQKAANDLLNSLLCLCKG